jgi:hypothetical protein
MVLWADGCAASLPDSARRAVVGVGACGGGGSRQPTRSNVLWWTPKTSVRHEGCRPRLARAYPRVHTTPGGSTSVCGHRIVLSGLGRPGSFWLFSCQMLPSVLVRTRPRNKPCGELSRMMAGRRRWEEPAEPFFLPNLVYRSVWGHQILASCDRQQTHTVVVFLLLSPGTQRSRA